MADTHDTAAMVSRAQAALEGTTPGPWTVPERYVSEIERADGKTISSCWHEMAIGQTIKLNDVVDCSLAESAANASLIASAPTLIADMADALTAQAAEIMNLSGALEDEKLQGAIAFSAGYEAAEAALAAALARVQSVDRFDLEQPDSHMGSAYMRSEPGYGEWVRYTDMDAALKGGAAHPAQINWRDDPTAIVEDDEPQIGRDCE